MVIDLNPYDRKAYFDSADNQSNFQVSNNVKPVS